MNEPKVVSPLNELGNVKLISKLKLDILKKRYLDSLSIDISNYFGSNKLLETYECLDTGYQFYIPQDISGDGKFYEHLQKFDWYYMPWKWEHAVTTKYLTNNYNLLEVGCAKGDFLASISTKVLNTTGLEFNIIAAQNGQQKGINILVESIEVHAIKNPSKYDIVCSFQVLEHIAQVRPFLQAQIDCLKSGGKLIVSVPNNDSFIRLDIEGCLNFPPHHMGRWNKKSLKNIANIFNLQLDKIYFEPLQTYHIGWYYNLHLNRIKNKSIKILYNYTLGKITKALLNVLRSRIIGHSIMAVYIKK